MFDLWKIYYLRIDVFLPPWVSPCRVAGRALTLLPAHLPTFGSNQGFPAQFPIDWAAVYVTFYRCWFTVCSNFIFVTGFPKTHKYFKLIVTLPVVELFCLFSTLHRIGLISSFRYIYAQILLTWRLKIKFAGKVYFIRFCLLSAHIKQH